MRTCPFRFRSDKVILMVWLLPDATWSRWTSASPTHLPGLKNDKLCSAVPKPRDEFSAQMPVSRTQELPAFTASCLQKVFSLSSGFAIYGDLLHLFSFSLHR